MTWAMLSSIEQMMLVALSDDGTALAELAKGADRLHQHIASVLRYVDTAMRRLDAYDPMRAGLEEIRAAALIAAAKLAELSEQACRPRLWLVP